MLHKFYQDTKSLEELTKSRPRLHGDMSLLHVLQVLFKQNKDAWHFGKGVSKGAHAFVSVGVVLVDFWNLIER